MEIAKQYSLTNSRHDYNLDLGFTTALLIAFIMQGIVILRAVYEKVSPKPFDIVLCFGLLAIWLLCQAIVKKRYVNN